MNSFHSDRDLRGRPAEYLLLELLHSRGIPASLNETPDPDIAPDETTRQLWLERRAAYDVIVAGEPWDVKIDWYSWGSHNICIEAPTLQHTQSHRLCYFFPRPSSFYIHTFTVQEAIEIYNAQTVYGDGQQVWKYPHKLVGDGKKIPAVLPPESILQEHGLGLWQVTKQLRQLTALQ